MEKVATQSVYNFINKRRRGNLNEGRSTGLGFAFCKPTYKSRMTTVQPISPCKDYLNDVVYSENTGKQCQAYGLSYKKKDIFKKGRAFVAMSVCNYITGGGYHKYETDLKNLKNNYKNIEKLINHYEVKLHLEPTVITEVGENEYLLNLPLFWTKYTYLISLYTLLIRVGQDYKEGGVEDFINNYAGEDSYLLTSAKIKLNKIIEGQVPEQNWAKYSGNIDVHNEGISSFQF